MRQSNRLMKGYAGSEIDEKQINCLLAEDFERVETVKDNYNLPMGFHCV